MPSTTDYKNAPVVWRKVKTRRNDGTVTEQWQAILRVKRSDGGGYRKRSKLFASSVDTERKRATALRKWRDELQKEADRAAQEAKQATGSTKTVKEYVSEYINELERLQAVERRTISDYRTTARGIEKGFPGVTMGELTPAMVQKWEGDMLDSGLSPRTVIKHHRMLSAVCKHAVNMEALTRNPCSAVKTPKAADPSPNSLTTAQFARLAATLERLEPTPLVVGAMIALHTGMRLGEVCGLRWREYDAANKTLRIIEAIGTGKGGDYSKAPKTTSSRRAVYVSPTLATMLARRAEEMRKQLETAGIQLEPEEFGRLYIIGRVDGGFHSPAVLSRDWKGWSETVPGLTGTRGRRVTFHDLRHSFATVAIAAGADVKAVSSLLGHTNAAITLNIYADADPASKRRAIRLLPWATDGVDPYEIEAEAAEE